MKSLTYVEIDIPVFAPDSPVVLTTMRFAVDTDYLPREIECIPSIKSVSYTPATISLGENLGQRATLSVTFKDHKFKFASESYDAGTFWGKFRARYGLKLRSRSIRLIRGFLPDAFTSTYASTTALADDVLTDQETRHFIIDSSDGPNPDTGDYKLIGKDVLKLADGDRAQAPAPSNGFLVAAVTNIATTATLSPSGIGNAEYPESGYLAIGGKEIAGFTRYTVTPGGDNDANCKSLLHLNGADGGAVFTDVNAGGLAKTWSASGTSVLTTAVKKFGTAGLQCNTSSIRTTDNADFHFGTANWTIEFWFNRQGIGGARGLFGQSDSTSVSTCTIGATFNSSNKVVLYAGGALRFTAGTTILDSLFHHYAFVRNGTTIKFYLDGVEDGTVTFGAGSIGSSVGQFYFGQIGFLSVGVPTTGVFDEIRISSVARYTTGFTPQVAEFTSGSGHVSTGDVLTLTRAQFNTDAVAHDQQDRVQLVLVYQGADPSDIIADLFENYAGMSSAYIPIDSWHNETHSFLNRVYTAVITEPTSVNKLVSELIEQAGLVIWPDNINNVVRLQVLRAVATTADTFSEESVLEGTLESREQPDKRLSQVITYFGKINPLLREDQLENCRSTEVTVDAVSEASYGSAAIKKIYSRWIPAFGRSIATRCNELQLARFRDPPRQFKFELFRGSHAVEEGGGYQLASWAFQDSAGAEINVPIQITRLNPEPERFVLEAEEMLFSGFTSDDPAGHAIIIDANFNNFNLRTVHDTLYGTPVSGNVVTCTVSASVTVGSVSTALPAFDVGSWPAGVTLSLINKGTIEGHGGSGGEAQSAGSAGGTALYTRQAIVLDNTVGQLWGGGGGGGGIGAGSPGPPPVTGGGGGGGQLPGVGAGGAADGTTTSGGSGGGTGGSGGGPGLAGAAGLFPPNAGAGGAAGNAVDGTSFVTYVAVGDRRGPAIN